MRKKVMWLIGNGIFLTAMGVGFLGGNAGAVSVAVFIAWATTLCAFLLFGCILFPGVAKKMAQNDQAAPTLPQGADIVYDFIICCAFAYFGHYATAFAYFLQIIASQSVWEALKEQRIHLEHTVHPKNSETSRD